MVKLVAGEKRMEDSPSVHVRYRGAPTRCEKLPDVARFAQVSPVINPFVEDSDRPFISALFSYTAKMNGLRAEFDEKEEHHVSHDHMELARRVKACSLFPNVYAKASKHRTFPKMVAEGADDSRDSEMAKRKGGEAYQAGSAAF